MSSAAMKKEIHQVRGTERECEGDKARIHHRLDMNSTARAHPDHIKTVIRDLMTFGAMLS